MEFPFSRRILTLTVLPLSLLAVVIFQEETKAEESLSDKAGLLTAAAGKGDLAEIESLLDAGVDVNVRDSSGWTALMRALAGRQLPAVKILLARKADPNLPATFGWTPLMVAADAESARELIQNGAKVKNLETPILPGLVRSPEAMKEVMRAGGDLDHKTVQQTLLAACHLNQDEAARIVLKHGADPNEPLLWAEGKTMLPLVICSVFNSTKAARILLEFGADPNGGDKPGFMIKTAMYNRHQEMTQILREAGATGTSDLAFYLATEKPLKVKELLAEAPGFGQDPAFWEDVLKIAALHGDQATVQMALKNGVPIRSSEEQDAFVAAAMEGQHEVLKLLISEGNQPHPREDLRPALWEAVWNSNPYQNQRPREDFHKVIKLLLDADTPVTPLDPERNLMVAAVFTRNPGGNPQVMQMLAGAGVDPNPKFQDKTLHEMVQASCAEKNCSTPLAECVARLDTLIRQGGAE